MTITTTLSIHYDATDLDTPWSLKLDGQTLIEARTMQTLGEFLTSWSVQEANKEDSLARLLAEVRIQASLGTAMSMAKGFSHLARRRP